MNELTRNMIKTIKIRRQLEALPSIISYSTLEIPISRQSAKVTLARRDLYDVRYQLIAQEEEGGSTDATRDESRNEDVPKEAELSYVDNPSDLAPGLYEGGLKTWECSLDLVDVLEGKIKAERGSRWARGKRVFEVSFLSALILSSLTLKSVWVDWLRDSYSEPVSAATAASATSGTRRVDDCTSRFQRSRPSARYVPERISYLV